MALSNVKIKMHLALQYSVVVGMDMPIFGVYVCSNESILSLALDPEGRIFSDSTVIISFTTLTRIFGVISFEKQKLQRDLRLDVSESS